MLPLVPDRGCRSGNNWLGGSGGGLCGGGSGSGSLIAPSWDSDDGGSQSGESGNCDLHVDRCEGGGF